MLLLVHIWVFFLYRLLKWTSLKILDTVIFSLLYVSCYTIGLNSCVSNRVHHPAGQRIRHSGWKRCQRWSWNSAAEEEERQCDAEEKRRHEAQAAARQCKALARLFLDVMLPRELLRTFLCKRASPTACSTRSNPSQNEVLCGDRTHGSNDPQIHRQRRSTHGHPATDKKRYFFNLNTTGRTNRNKLKLCASHIKKKKPPELFLNTCWNLIRAAVRQVGLGRQKKVQLHILHKSANAAII